MSFPIFPGKTHSVKVTSLSFFALLSVWGKPSRRVQVTEVKITGELRGKWSFHLYTCTSSLWLNINHRSQMLKEQQNFFFKGRTQHPKTFVQGVPLCAKEETILKTWQRQQQKRTQPIRSYSQAAAAVSGSSAYNLVGLCCHCLGALAPLSNPLNSTFKHFPHLFFQLIASCPKPEASVWNMIPRNAQTLHERDTS